MELKKEKLESESTSFSSVIGLFLREKRISAGVSEWELLEYLSDVSVSQLRDYEAGRKAIPLADICAIVNRLNIDPGIVQKLLNEQLANKKVKKR
jgi:transcriptional regulator with XRE-family HTH domain